MAELSKEAVQVQKDLAEAAQLTKLSVKPEFYIHIIKVAQLIAEERRGGNRAKKSVPSNPSFGGKDRVIEEARKAPKKPLVPTASPTAPKATSKAAKKPATPRKR